MKFVTAFALLASLAAAAPVQQAESIDLSKRLDGPLTVKLTFNTPPTPVGIEANKQQLALKYPQLFDASQLAHLQSRADNIVLTNYAPDISWTAPTNIGTPAQQLQLLVDTGSPALWAFSSKCQGCGTGTFDPSKSSTFQNTSQPVTFAYGDGSTYIKGFAVKDSIGLGTVESPNIDWALIDQQVQMGLSDVSAGLSGWSWPVTDAGSTETLPVPYVQATTKQWSDPTFGLYLNRKGDRAAAQGVQSKGDGAITISGVDSTYFDGSLTWTTRKVLSDRFSFAWGVDFPSLTINGKKHTLAAGTGAVLDSGTTLIYGPSAAVTAFYKDYKGAVSVGGGVWTVPCDNFSNKVSFNFAGKDWPIQPVDLIYDSNQAGTCIGGLVVNPGLKAGNDWLVGGAFLKNVYSAHRYDPPGVGFAPLKAGL